VVTCCSLLLAGWLNISTGALRPMQLQEGFARFPLRLQQWTGHTETLDDRIVRLSGAEKAFNAAYFSPSGEIVSLYMGYRGSPFTESENFFHSPNVCLPSLGWKTLQIEHHTIDNVPVHGQLTIRKMLIEKMGVRQLVYYWFQTNRRVSADVHLNRLHLTLHALRRNNTYDLFLRPMTPLAPAESIAVAEGRLDAFTRVLVSTLTSFLAENIMEPEPAG
jgi:EpsI family protein